MRRRRQSIEDQDLPWRSRPPGTLTPGQVLV
jgi:hypothetical protein